MKPLPPQTMGKVGGLARTKKLTKTQVSAIWPHRGQAEMEEEARDADDQSEIRGDHSACIMPLSKRGAYKTARMGTAHPRSDIPYAVTMRCTVQFPMPNARAIARIPRPCFRRVTTCASTAALTRGRPKTLPSAFARFRPALTRSRSRI
jgi:hypothetical protein